MNPSAFPSLTSLPSHHPCNMWVSKFRTVIVCVITLISHSSESIWVIKLSFCQNDSPMVGLFWQKDGLFTHILSELWLISNYTHYTSTIFADSHVSKHQNHEEDRSNFCGLLRKADIYNASCSLFPELFKTSMPMQTHCPFSCLP